VLLFSRFSDTSSTAISCLFVTGNTAIIGISGISGSRFGGAFPVAGLIRVVDGGGAGSSLDRVDPALIVGPDGGPPIPGPTTCASFPGTFPCCGFPVVNLSGDIVVTDVPPPPPTMKDECKNGDWKTFGVFKNQGDSVSFVATKGKNSPAKPG
jgi:hypothetical protein